MFTPDGIYEGAFAQPNPQYQLSNPPFPAMPGGPFAAAPGGVIQGRFGWADPTTGLVSNVPTTGAALGVVVPQRGTFARVYFDPTVKAWRIRQGLPATLCLGGPFWLRFQFGAVAGTPAYADSVDGHAVSGYAAGAVLTRWTVTTGCEPGGLAVISSTAFVGA